MAYEVILENELCLRVDLIPCAHFCRYCSISSSGPGKVAALGFRRFHALVDRFEEWSKTSGYSVSPIVHNSDDITREVADFLDETIGPPGTVHSEPITPKDAKLRLETVRTGGVRFRSDDGIREWLSRWRDTGSTIVHGSFAGYREIHDWWNNRPGDYDFLMRIQQVAIEMEFQVSHTVFLTKNMLPSLDRLLEDLNRLPATPVNRWAFAPTYLGRARNSSAENQRITEEDRDRLAQNSALTETYTLRQGKSEREFIKELGANKARVPSHSLDLYVEDQNIRFLESAPCGRIVDDLRAKVEASYQAIPSSEELMSQYGDPDGTKVYDLQFELDSLWLDRCLREQDIRFERRLTHMS